MDIEQIRSRHWALPSRGGSDDIETLLGEVDRLRRAISNMADDNSPHDAQHMAENYAAEWDEGWR